MPTPVADCDLESGSKYSGQIPDNEEAPSGEGASVVLRLVSYLLTGAKAKAPLVKK